MLVAECIPILPWDSQVDPAYLSDVAHTKRFLEYWSADPAFREALPQDPSGVSKAAGLQAEAESIRPLWEQNPNSPIFQQPFSLSVQRYRAFMQEKVAYRDFLRNCGTAQHAGYRAWRQRQILRCNDQLGVHKGESLVHACLAVELSSGCSVGCWFCGISAQKLKGVWPYDPANASLWRGVLQAMKHQLGPAAGRGFCYWATDPLDNPDYESFCGDFSAILGRYPQTTTAQPLRDPDRFRKLHQAARQAGNEIDRFSVLTLGTLKKLFAEYTPEELLFVELVLQMDGAYAGKAYAGKARTHQSRWQKSTARPIPPDEETSTIACVSGILLRMPEKSFELVSPTRADAKWPDGYRVHTRHTFTDAADFEAQLKRVFDALPQRLPLDRPARLRSDLQLELLEDGFALAGHFYRHSFRSPGMRPLGQALIQCEGSATELALSIEHEVPLEQTLAQLNQLFCQGLLDDEP